MLLLLTQKYTTCFDSRADEVYALSCALYASRFLCLQTWRERLLCVDVT